MPDWGNIESVRAWIRAREKEEEEKKHDAPTPRMQGPKTREEYEREMAALRSQGEIARSWREPVKAYDRPDVQQVLNQSGGRSAELLRLLSMTGEGAGGQQRQQQPAWEPPPSGLGGGRGGQGGRGVGIADVLRGAYEAPQVQRASSPYQPWVDASRLDTGEDIPAWLRWQMGDYSPSQRMQDEMQAPGFNGWQPPASTPMQHQAAMALDQQQMDAQAMLLPAEQRYGGWDIAQGVYNLAGPAGVYFEERRNQRTAENEERRRQGTQSWYDVPMAAAGNVLDAAFYVPGKALTSADTNPLMDFMVAGTALASGLPIPEVEPERPRGPTIAQVVAPIGGALNKMLNPFNPNKFDWTMPEPGEGSVGAKVFSQAGDYIWSEWQKHNAMNQALVGLPEEQRREAELALLNATSGADHAWDTWTAIQQKQNAQTLRDTAAQLEAQGDTNTASQMYQTYREMQAKSYADIVDENQNVWAEMIEGIFADPMNIVLDPLVDAGMAAWRTSRATSKIVKASQASTKRLDQAVAEGIALTGRLEDGVTTPAAKDWIQQLFGRTAETKAHMEADALWKSATQLFRGVDNAADAKLLLQTWIENPAQLIQGVQGLSSRALRAVAGVADDKVRYGYLTVAGDEQLQALPVLQTIKDRLLSLPALNAEGGFNALEFLTQMDDVIYKGVRQKYGLAALEELGDGVVKWNVRRLDAPGANGEKWVVDYLNKDGGVMRTSDAMSYEAAKKQTTDIQKALDAGKKTPTVQGALKMIGTVQRGFLSDFWLNLRPSHWIRNAAAATAATMADDLYTLRSVSGILDDLGAKFVGGGATQRIHETLTGAGKMAGGQAGQSAMADGQHWSRAIWEKNNPYASLNEAASQVWSGMTHLFGTDIPFGEQAFYLRAFDKGFNRTFSKVWGDVVHGALDQQIAQLGIDPKLGQSIVDSVISAGVNGSKQDVAQAARKAVYGSFASFDPRSLGIPDELLSAQGWKAVQNGIEEWLQSSPTPGSTTMDEMVGQVRRIFDEEKLRYGNILRNGAPQPGVYEWSKLDVLDDAAEMMDNLIGAAKRAGVDEAQATQQAQQLATAMTDGQQAALDSFLQEVATANNPAAMNVAFDLLTTLHGLKTAARREVDQLSRLAADSGSAEMWAQKWQETGRIYTQLTGDLEQTILGAADDLRTVVAGGEVPRKYDWWASLRRYFDYDQQKVAELRLTPLGGTKDDPALWEAAIEANRQYIDASMVQLYDAFRRYPSVDALDVLRQTQKQIDVEGARVAAWLGGLRDEALQGTLKWDDYFNARNGAWYRAFDNMAIYNEAAKRAIVAEGLAAEAPSKLRWVDEFAGGEFFLVGPSGKEGRWLARRIDDGTMHEFDTPGRYAQSAMPMVPQNVLDDWKVVTQQSDRMKPVLEEIDKANPLPVRKQTGGLTLETVPETGETFRGLREPATAEELRQITDLSNDVDFGMRSSYRPDEPPAPQPAGPQPQTPGGGGAATASLDEAREALARGETVQVILPSGPERVTAITQSGPEWVLSHESGSGRLLYKGQYKLKVADQAPTARTGDALDALPPPRPGESLLNKQMWNPAYDATPLTFYYNPDAARFWKSPDGRWRYASVAETKGQGYITVYGTADQATAAAPGGHVVPVQVVSDRPREFNPGVDPDGRARLRNLSAMSELGAFDAVFITNATTSDALIESAEQLRSVRPAPNARLTKPANWESTQRAQPLGPGAQVRHRGTGETYTVNRASKSGGWYWVTDAAGKERKFKSNSLEGLEKPVAWVKPGQAQAVQTLAAQGKKTLIAEHGEQLRSMGYTDGQLRRFSAEEIGHAVTGTSKAPKPAIEQSWLAYQGQAEMFGKGEQRESMRQLWDAEVVAKYGEHLDLEKLVRRFNKDGMINIQGADRITQNPREIEGLFEDMLGANVGGTQLDNLGDIERFMQQYVDAGTAFTENKAAIGEARQFKGMGVTEIIAETYDELKAGGMTDADIRELATTSRRQVLEWLAAMRNKTPDMDSPFAGMITYESRTPTLRGMTGGPSFLTDDPKETLDNLYDLMRRFWGRRKQPEVGDVAVHMIQSLDDAAERLIAALPELAQRTPNTLDAGQKRFLLQALDGLLPTFDNAVAESRRVGESLANTAMLNYQDRRGFDSMLSLMFPYHYFWTRGGATWAKRLMTQPKTLNLVYETDRAIQNANARQDVPQRLDNAIPLANVPGGQVYAGNIMNWLLPQVINEFVDPEAANSNLERYIMRFQQLTPGLMPATQFLMDSYFDMAAPLPNGQKRVETSVRRFIPMWGAASDVSQALTGQPLPHGGDQYDPYRTRRALSMMAQEGAFDGETAQYAQQIAVNLENGRDRFAGIPAQAQQQADAAYTEGMKRAGSERALSSVSGLVAGAPMYYYPDAEREMRQAQRDYGTAGYDPAINPYGSAGQRREVLAENPGLPVYWSRNQAEGKLEPAQAAQRSEMWGLLDSQVYGPMSDAVTRAILNNPDITEKELNAIKSPYYDKSEKIRSRYADIPGSDPKPPSGANPQERAIYELERLLDVPGKPTYPGDGATDAQMRAYYDERSRWEEQQLNTIDQRLNQLTQQVEMDPSNEWQQELARMVQGRYSSDLLRQIKEMKYATDVEKNWAEREALRQEQSAANWNSKRGAVEERTGPEGVAAWQQYHDAAKGPERDAVKQGNPLVREVLMAGYNPNEYDQALTLFGPEAWQSFYDTARPKYPEGGDQAALQQYYDALKAWNQENPYDAEMRFWVNGRPVTGEFAYDFGDDWEEAKRIFGDDIFEIDRISNTTNDWVNWRNANPDAYMRLTGYKEWRKVAIEGREAEAEMQVAFDPNGPRPLGSERRPVGAADWDAGLTQPPAAIKSDNLSLLGGEPGLGGQGGQNVLGVPTAGSDTQGVPAAGSDAMPTTAEGWAMRNASYAKYQQGAVQWEQRKQAVYQQFGKETGSLYEQYLALPSNSQQRKDFKAQHPELRAVQLYTFQPEAYVQAEQLFGQDGIMAWARTPAYQDTPEAKAARSEYLDQNPKAFSVGAWLYGRPGSDNEDTADDEKFRYNLGEDYASAKEMFGANIWLVVEGYKRNWPKAVKSQYYKENPGLSPFFDWWYGNLPKSNRLAQLQSRAAYSGGGWGGGGRWKSRPQPVPPPRIDRQWMDRDLEVGEQEIRRWRPPQQQVDLSWLRAGDRLRPEQLRAWRAPRQ